MKRALLLLLLLGGCETAKDEVVQQYRQDVEQCQTQPDLPWCANACKVNPSTSWCQNEKL